MHCHLNVKFVINTFILCSWEINMWITYADICLIKLMPSGAKWPVSPYSYRPLLCYSYDLISFALCTLWRNYKHDRGLDQYFPKRLFISKPVGINFVLIIRVAVFGSKKHSKRANFLITSMYKYITHLPFLEVTSTSCSKVFLETLTVPQLVKKLSTFMETEGLLLYSKKPYIFRFPKPVESISLPPFYFLRSSVTSFSHLRLCFPSCSFTKAFPPELCMDFTSPT